MPRRVLIMGAAGRDFHNFNVVYREDEGTEVVAFTATQIPFISDRRYPPELAGPRYPDGIPIHDESELVRLIKDHQVQEVVFAYSDVSHEYVMHKASEVLAAGADFTLLGPVATMLSAKVPVVSVSAVRTGSGKSQTSRAVVRALAAAGEARRGGSSPDALRRPERTTRATLRDSRRSRPARVSLSRSVKSTRSTSTPGPSCTPAWTTETFFARLKKSATSCCGTAATTTCPFTARPSTSSWWTRSGPGTRQATTPER